MVEDLLDELFVFDFFLMMSFYSEYKVNCIKYVWRIVFVLEYM